MAFQVALVLRLDGVHNALHIVAGEEGLDVVLLSDGGELVLRVSLRVELVEQEHGVGRARSLDLQGEERKGAQYSAPSRFFLTPCVRRTNSPEPL